MSKLDRFHEKVEHTIIYEYFDDIDDVYIFDVELQGHDENVNNIDLEETLDEVNEDFNYHQVIFL